MGGVNEDERSARLRLSRLAEPGDQRLGAAVAGSDAVSVLARIEQGDPTLPGVEHLRSRLATDPEQDVARLENAGGRFLVPGDAEWPTQLEALGAATPIGLYVVGANLRLAAIRSVSVVGARAASEYGQYVASELATDLGLREWTVVSGGAYGIDAAAHRGAVAAGAVTEAVLACGVDVSYPRGHNALFTRIREGSGSLVSELPPGAHPTRPRFLQRNRVIAALTRGTVVVEAALRSGALSTAASARRLGRPVMAVPGPVTSPTSGGCHRLLRADEPTRLVTNAAEVIEEVGMIGELAEQSEPVRRVRDALDELSLRVLEAFPHDATMTTGELAAAAGVAVPTTAGIVLRLVAAGMATETPEGYRRVPGAADAVHTRAGH